MSTGGHRMLELELAMVVTCNHLQQAADRNMAQAIGTPTAMTMARTVGAGWVLGYRSKIWLTSENGGASSSVDPADRSPS